MKVEKKQRGVASMQRGGNLNQLESLSWDDLRVFLATCEAGAMRKAASRLSLNASTVSRRLSALENVLGTQLLERHPEGLLLTPAGEEVRAFAGRLSEEVELMKNQVAGRDQEIEGRVRITSAEAVSALVNHSIVDLLESYPLLELEIIASDTMSDLGRHEAEIAVRVAERPPEYLVGTRLGHCQVGIFGCEKYLERFGDDFKHEGHRWVAWPSYVEKKPAFQWLDQECPARRTSVRANSAHGVFEALRSGLGLAPLALTQAAVEPSLVLLQRLPANCATAAWLLTQADTRKSARVRAVLSHMDKNLREALNAAQSPVDSA